MNLDKEAEKIMDEVSRAYDWQYGAWDDEKATKAFVVDVLRRCAEAMREECEELAKARGNLAIAVAISRVEVK